MPNRRAEIQMTEFEVAQFLAGTHKLYLATRHKNGTIHLMAMWYVMREGRPAVWTYAKSQKAVNVAADSSVTCLVEAGDSYASLRGVQMVGHAEVIRDPNQVRAVGQSLAERYMAGAPSVEVKAFLGTAGKRVVLDIHPARVVSYDHSKL
jgi:PPOX class probable F420-dependent enzyme